MIEEVDVNSGKGWVSKWKHKCFNLAADSQWHTNGKDLTSCPPDHIFPAYVSNFTET